MKMQNTLKAFFAMLVMALFAVSIVPITFAADVVVGDRAQLKEQIKENIQEKAELRKDVADAKQNLVDARADAADAKANLVQKRQETRDQIKKTIDEKRKDPEFQKRVEKAKDALQLPPEQRNEKIKALSAEEFREFQKKQLMVAVDKCKDNPNIDQQKCQDKLEKRVELIGKLSEKDAERLKKIEERKTEKIQNLKELANKPEFAKYKEAKEGAVKAREIAKEKLQNVKEKYEKAKNQFDDIKQKEQQKNQELQQAREQLKAACSDKESDVCKQVQEQVRVKAKEVLTRQADLMLESIEKIKAKVEASEDLDEAEAAKIVAELDAKKAEIENAKKTIESSQTKEELIAAAKTINGAWENSKNALKNNAAKVVNSRMGGIIVQSKQLEVKLERVLAKMQENGADTTTVQLIVDKFNADIASAKKHYELAVADFKSNATDKDVKSVQEHMKLAKDSLEAARKDLAEIAKELRAMNQGSLLTETETDDAEEAVETEAVTDEEVEQADSAQQAVEVSAAENAAVTETQTTETTA